MHLTVQLDARSTKQLAAIVGISHLVAAVGVACAGAAALIWAIRWRCPHRRQAPRHRIRRSHNVCWWRNGGCRVVWGLI